MQARVPLPRDWHRPLLAMQLREGRVLAGHLTRPFVAAWPTLQ